MGSTYLNRQNGKPQKQLVDYTLRSRPRLRLSPKPRLRILSIAHGAFYIVSGLWPVLSMRTFEKVTGPKQDDWLAKTVGLLIAVSGTLLLRSGYRRSVSQELAANCAGQAFVLGSISAVYSLKGRISKIYLIDSAMQYSLMVLWYFATRGKFFNSNNYINMN